MSGGTLTMGPDCPARAAAPAAARGRGLPEAGDAISLYVPGIRCAGCISAVERRLAALPGVSSARVNFSRRRVAIAGLRDPAAAIAALAEIGYPARELDGAALAGDDDRTGRALLMRLAVAGFAMMNVMLLSVAVWSGAQDATRDLFHWVSAAIALPTAAFAAQPFFVSAAGALRRRRLNMDVPISLAIALACGMSLYETALGGRHAYFDAALALTFFLLAGRYLDHRTRRAARSAATELAALEAPRVVRLTEAGSEAVPPGLLRVGDRIRLLPGERLAVDGRLLEGRARMDRAFLSGESAPVPVAPGAALSAGEINLDGRLLIEATAVGEATTLRRMAALVEVAERARNRYTALADRAAAIYAPAVHLLALAAFAGWAASTGDVRHSLNVAIAVLIITCPCALGLAVPAVMTAAAGRLFRRGFLVKSGTALERLGEIDAVVFDKTGTLTLGGADIETDALSAAEREALACLAGASTHPAARAVAAALGPGTGALEAVAEVAGQGVAARWNGESARLGRAEWVGGEGSGTAFRLGDGPVHRIRLREILRPGAGRAVAALKAQGLAVHLLSGDRTEAAAAVAGRLGIGNVCADTRPEGKTAYLSALARDGARVLMVGDGLNDTAALAAAHASISPATALEASRAVSDIVLLRDDLGRLAEALGVARAARRRVVENFAIAAGYNAVAIPLALAGLATPLIAALAMSASSITVILNALRLR